VIWLLLYILTAISIERPRRVLSFDMFIDRDVFKMNQITLYLRFTFIPETGPGPGKRFSSCKPKAVYFSGKVTAAQN